MIMYVCIYFNPPTPRLFSLLFTLKARSPPAPPQCYVIILVIYICATGQIVAAKDKVLGKPQPTNPEVARLEPIGTEC